MAPNYIKNTLYMAVVLYSEHKYIKNLGYL
ncbi:hypothetical protein GGR21_000188 [Dysgonomonas hofstadii]|uniref:Uncharacterized protein n=1 Tax=Dysgonomonas hofstadii TaxID=637886 RepID=A0A840CRC7_9BACT|nr:hypothetical protein [Dysgonomonas hofstadii]